METDAPTPPQVIATRRGDDSGPETVEIVLDRAIPTNHPIRFIFNDGKIINYVEYNKNNAMAGPITAVCTWGLAALSLFVLM